MNNYLFNESVPETAACDKIIYVVPKCKVLKMNKLHILSNSVSDYTGGNTYNAKGFGNFEDEEEESEESQTKQAPLDNNELENY
jgi:hypothetical protein